MVILQLYGGSILQHSNLATSATINRYVTLSFGINLLFGLLYLFNFIIRQFFVINDTTYILISRLNLQIQVQYAIDTICGLVALTNIILATRLLIPNIS